MVESLVEVQAKALSSISSFELTLTPSQKPYIGSSRTYLNSCTDTRSCSNSCPGLIRCVFGCSNDDGANLDNLRHLYRFKGDCSKLKPAIAWGRNDYNITR
ncbi:hypothetical protein HPP92_007746 [Vanilla planifolia]|uniref:Uncharacterized protein n=1 Tax=Vanilla planifolia TaxID=51239 RepID=A0A835V9P9_VANPL|nr:hypothetical protein HPP92_007746 [Vanilla planifolia]